MRTRRSVAALASVAAICGLTQLAPAEGASSVQARPAAVKPGKTVDRSLGNGLGRLVAPQSVKSHQQLKVDQGALAIKDDRGRILIDLTPDAGVDRAAYRKQVERLGLVVTATDQDSGTIEGYAPVAAITTLAGLGRTGTIKQELRPVTHAGSTTSQGVDFERVDRLLSRGIRGQGMTVGVLSDSYDTAEFDLLGNPLHDHAAEDVASGDLPGPGNPENSQPVVVIEDGSSPETDTDEGRAMLQIVHDVAPDAKLCFATAFGGDIGFANNIRALADRSGPCRADVIVDDVSYFDEPFFSDGPIGDAVDDVESQGVSYFSSSGNSGDHNAWEAPVRLIDAQRGVRGTNLKLEDVDPALYAGGLEDMDPGRGTDVAQTYTTNPASPGLYDLQWDDPVDRNGAQLGDPYFSAAGEITTATPEATFTFSPTADQIGKQVLFNTDAIPSGTTDLILDVTKPDGTELGPVDTGASPEKLSAVLDQPGDWTIQVSGFNGATGDFTVDVRPIVSPSKVTTDFNVLVFDPDGNYLGAVGDDNTLTGQPAEVFQLPRGFPEVQFVIARATTGPVPVHHLRAIMNGDLYVSEYYNPFSPATFGHPTAAGAIGVGAYDPFKSYLPESYTSPGGKLQIYYDSEGNRYRRPQVRTKPEVSATDRGNTTFFVSDDARDADSFPNFGGTSASAPHAAAIATLMIQKAGGPGALSPDQVRSRLERSAFDHDLDPFRAGGSAQGLRISAVGDQADERNWTPGSLADPNFFRVAYSGKVPLRSITFYGETASPTSLQGLVFDPRPEAAPGSYREGGFPFTVGATRGVRRDSVSAAFSQRFDGLPEGVFQHLTVKFANGLKRGQSFGFGVDRDAALWAPTVPAIEGNGADELGGAVAIPSDRRIVPGMRFTAVLANGRKIDGRFVNRLGSGWTAVDGYGVVNAERAVLGGR